MYFPAPNTKARRIKAWACADSQIANTARIMCNIRRHKTDCNRTMEKAIAYNNIAANRDNKRNR